MTRQLLRLYVAGSSANSLLALRNLEQFCASLPDGSFELEVVDILLHPQAALAARLLVTPTLEVVRRGQAAPQRLVGTLQDTRQLQALLTAGTLGREVGR